MPDENTPVRLLLIEDDVRLAGLVKDYLEQENFQIRTEHRGDTAMDNFDPAKTDIVIVDLMLPGKDGLSVCRDIRSQFAGPILILTAKSSDIDHVMGLELGADDFVMKPIEPPVLLARLRALLRRSQTLTDHRQTTALDAGEASKRLQFGGLIIDLRSHTVILDEDVIELTTQEFELLAYLAGNAGNVLSRDDIFSSMRGIEYDGLDRTVDVRISRLRKKLRDNPEHPVKIKTVWGKGYLFVADAWT